MTRQQSFTKAENELLPKFRKMINEAESIEDVKKFFARCMQDLLGQASAGRLEPKFEDISLLPEQVPPFFISEQIRAREEFTAVWEASDLQQIITRFAEVAVGHYKHLAKNPMKTESKIRV